MNTAVLQMSLYIMENTKNAMCLRFSKKQFPVLPQINYLPVL